MGLDPRYLRTCDQCNAGYHFRCANELRYYGNGDFDQGSFATYAVQPDTHIQIIPNSIDLELTAPFLYTVAIPLLRRDV